MKNTTVKRQALKKMKTPDRKLVMTLAGVAVVAGSVVAVADYVRRKKHQKAAHAAELILGIAGVAAGTLLATEPRREANRITLELDDIFEGVDLEIARRQVREALNRGEAEVEAEDTAPVIVVEEVEAEVLDIAPEVAPEAVEAEIIEITPVTEETPVAEAEAVVEVEAEVVEAVAEAEPVAEAEAEAVAEEAASEESAEA